MDPFPFAAVFGGLGALGLLLIILLVPIVLIFHFITKWKATRGLSREEERMLEELLQSSQSMESRLNALETILDDQAPSWRSKV